MAASVLLVLALVATTRASAAWAEEYGTPVPGQRVYDRAGVLSSGEVAELEVHAESVEQAGAPTVVYLRLRDSDYRQTEEDARDLMEVWDVQSAPGARDGLVIFLNLEPEDPRHGYVALFAGERHYQDGRLPDYEVQRIYEEVMLPFLADRRLAAGIRAGLDAAEQSLTVGPPPPRPPSPAEQAATVFVRAPLAALSVLLLAGLTFLAAQTHRARPKSLGVAASTTVPPSDLPPALAGALVRRRVGHEQVEATILDLARRGALVIEPSGQGQKVQLRLLDPRAPSTDYEQHVWAALSEFAEQGLLSNERISKVLRGRYARSAREALRAGLRDRGWYQEQTQIDASRRPLMIVGGAALILAAVGFAGVILTEEVWALVWVGLLFAAGIAAISYAAVLPETTQAGEDAAVPWRAYLAGLKSSRHDHAVGVDLDEAMPYAVAMGATADLKRRLETASQQGYSPLWLGRSEEGQQWPGGFYPYWASFHSGVTPSSATGGTTGGGASVGGGGAGGRF